MQTGIGDSNVQLTRVCKKLCVLSLRPRVTVLPHGQEDINVESPKVGIFVLLTDTSQAPRTYM